DRKNDDALRRSQRQPAANQQSENRVLQVRVNAKGIEKPDAVNRKRHLPEMRVRVSRVENSHLFHADELRRQEANREDASGDNGSEERDRPPAYGHPCQGSTLAERAFFSHNTT